MIRSLSAVQSNILRRSRDGLRVWEDGAALAALLAELTILVELGLVAFEEATGYEATVEGEACLVRLGF